MADTIKALEQNGHTYSERRVDLLQDLDASRTTASWRTSITPASRAARAIDSDKYEKEDARDFVLWKATKEGEPTWDPGIGPGRPGWHIECSAMALRLLGAAPIDIHAGGVDLIFPHHENEIAQSEGATGRQFSRFWVHVEHLMIETGPEDEAKVRKRCRSRSATSTTSRTSSITASGRPRCATCISACTTASS